MAAKRQVHCGLCKRKLPRKNGLLDLSVIYSRFTRQHYCGPGEMERCRELRARQLAKGGAA